MYPVGRPLVHFLGEFLIRLDRIAGVSECGEDICNPQIDVGGCGRRGGSGGENLLQQLVTTYDKAKKIRNFRGSH